MPQKNDSSAPKGDFIDLEKNQYKKKSNLKRNIFLILSILSVILLVYVNLEHLNLTNFFSEKTSVKRSNQDVAPEDLIIKNNNNFASTEEIKKIYDRLNDLNKEIVDNKIKLSEAESIISGLKKEIRILESQRRNNVDFFNTEKYIILNDLLSLKNKFRKRKNFQRELESLISRFSESPDIKTIIIYLQDIVVKDVTTLEVLLEKINRKINIYEKDMDSFIETNFKKEYNDSDKIFESQESFLNYLKNLMNSIFKVTKLKKYSNDLENESKQKSFVSFLKEAKEYLIVGNIEKAIQILSNTNFDDYEINNWLEEAKVLVNIETRIETLESKLLDFIGNDAD